ncbi:MAG: DUF2721 domain-containing protein [Verrucomicrobia bacterium]|nr:DUF2721 domain-containing protein [Leptolyngbya sp. ES-bin-22]
MTSDTIVKAISLILAPVVMITACAIIQNGLITHYAAISNHLRSVNQEILSLAEIDLSDTPSRAVYLHDLEHLLLPDLLRRNHIVHHVLGGIYTAILVLIVDMFVIAIAIAIGINWLAQVVLMVFLLGVGILCWSILLVVHELRTSHRSIQLEVHHTCDLCQAKRRK